MNQDQHAFAQQFARHFVTLDELAEWEERKWLVRDLQKVAEFLEMSGRWENNWQPDTLPNLGPTFDPGGDSTDEAINRLARWTLEVMRILDMDATIDPESTPLENVQAVVDAIIEAALPR